MHCAVFRELSSQSMVFCTAFPHRNMWLLETIVEGYGYQQMSCYRGGSTEQEFIGWNGLSGKPNSTHILNDILNVRLDEVLMFTFTKASEGIPERWSTKSFWILAVDVWWSNLQSTRSWPSSIFIWNQSKQPSTIALRFPSHWMCSWWTNSPLIYPKDAQMQGDHIKVPLKLPNNKGRHCSFTIRVSVSSHVEGDPLFDCKEYGPLHTYGDCIQEELKNIFENFQLVPGSFTNHHHHHQSSSSSSSIIRCHRLIAKTIQGLQKMRAVWNWNSNSGRDPH